MDDPKSSLTTFKILLIGASGVGKSSLLMKYVKNIFSYDYQVTTGIEFFTKTTKVNDKNTIKLQIWDTVGQENFRSVVRSFYKGVSAILLVYSIDKYDTFEQLGSWMRQIQQNSHKQTLIWVVGAKLDLQDIRKVSKKKGEEYSKSIDAAGFMQVSSKTGENVKQLFEKLSRTLYKKYTSNQNFRELVQPINTGGGDVEKTQSFNLANYQPIKGKRQSTGCC